MNIIAAKSAGPLPSTFLIENKNFFKKIRKVVTNLFTKATLRAIMQT